MIGYYLENDLVPLRPMEPILGANTTHATVMASRITPEGVPNWLIFSKSKSPLLKRWMEDYRNDVSWNHLATQAPLDYMKGKDPYLRVLGEKTWFYPLTSDPDGDVSLKRLWFGKTWTEIDESYGTHVWHWLEGFRNIATPEVVRLIDTPLFCRLRGMFDGVDGKKSLSKTQDPSCAITNTTDLDSANHRLVADYAMGEDRHPIKLLDSSGHNLHGWAPNGTDLVSNGRAIVNGTYATFPVPDNWDARTLTLQLSLGIDPSSLSTKRWTSFLKIRYEKEESLTLSFRLAKPSIDTSNFNSDTLSTNTTPPSQPPSLSLLLALNYTLPRPAGKLHTNEPLNFSTPTFLSSKLFPLLLPLPPPPSTSPQSYTLNQIPLSIPSDPSSQLATLTISLNRSPPLTPSSSTKKSSSDSNSTSTFHKNSVATAGTLDILVNNTFVLNAAIPPLHSPKIAQDVWLNALGWDELDCGFRGVVGRMTVFADAVDVGNVTTGMMGLGAGRAGEKGSRGLRREREKVWKEWESRRAHDREVGPGGERGGGGGGGGGGNGTGMGMAQRIGEHEGRIHPVHWPYQLTLLLLGLFLAARFWGRIRRGVDEVRLRLRSRLGDGSGGEREGDGEGGRGEEKGVVSGLLKS